MANFFFYALGSDSRQKSLMGLRRTLLYQILTASPGLMQFLLPDKWATAVSQPEVRSAFEILDDEVEHAFKRLARQHDRESLGGCCFSFFIDGLDEYQATTSIDRREMVHSLMEIANSASDSFKICVSSRIENPFMDMFSEETRLYLHELTRADMEQYVQGNLQHVGTENERRQLVSSITAKAEGVFLWVVLVVQNIRKRSDDGARFPRLLAEVQSLPTELNELFQRILDSLGTRDRQMASHTISLLLLQDDVPDDNWRQLWPNLSDFYFLEDYESNRRFAESARFPEQGCDPVKESGVRASRQLRGVCRGLVEANIVADLEFTHRSVRDFFQQEEVRVKMHDKSFNAPEALSQLKLASIKQYWWDAERQNGSKDVELMKGEEGCLSRHSKLVPRILELRRHQHLDTPPFGFLQSLDTIPQLSVSAMISRSLISNKTAFRVELSWTEQPIVTITDYEICHTSRVRHISMDDDHGMPGDCVDDSIYWRKNDDESNNESSAVPWRPYDEDVDDSDYATAVISPLLSELCSGRLEYPLWRVSHLHEMPLESDALAMLAYLAILLATGISNFSIEKFPLDRDTMSVTGLGFLEHILEQQILSPNLLTYLAFSGDDSIVRIAAGNQRLSLWQHFLCWWAAVAAASGDFEKRNPDSWDGRSERSLTLESSERGTTSDDEQSETSFELDSAEGDTDSDDYPPRDPTEQSDVGLVLECFIRNGADLHLSLRIEDGREIPTGADDAWLAYAMEIIPNGGKPLELDVAVNLSTRRIRLDGYPCGAVSQRWLESCGDMRPRKPLPSSALSVRDWIDRSGLPNKHTLMSLIDEKSADVEAGAVPVSNESQDE